MIAVRAREKGAPWIDTLLAACHTAEFKAFIEERSAGHEAGGRGAKQSPARLAGNPTHGP
ncbi:hypothetical protein [Rhodobaculum claviforme]|uniref:hypothetical protein n=1 Tax=Rhodobaculum claviforme TaxID=1549854 RepID=UPI001914665D|nr:hypothetical protein [Rhodobaculum claviforme]